MNKPDHARALRLWWTRWPSDSLVSYLSSPGFFYELQVYVAMHDTFLVIRTVSFALLTYFYFLVLVTASWNIAAAKSFGISAPGASVFLLINSILIFVLVPMAYLAEVICARARPAHVRVECAWTAVMSIFQLAASVDVTVNGPPIFCQTNLPWAMCASSSLLVHVSWLVTLIIFSYFLMICITSAARATSHPDIWTTPVPHVPWFRPDIEAPVPVTTTHLLTSKHPKATSSSMNRSSCAISKYIAERWGKSPSGPILFTKDRQSTGPIRPTWARQHPVRRGVDDPFAKPLPIRKEPPVVLTPPPRTYSRHAATPWNPHSVEDSEQQETARTVFGATIIDPDFPIPRPNLSQWVRADALSWISFHTEQSASP